MSASDLYFFGSALLAAGCFLLLLTYGLAARYLYERNHKTGAGSAAFAQGIGDQVAKPLSLSSRTVAQGKRVLDVQPLEFVLVDHCSGGSGDPGRTAR